MLPLQEPVSYRQDPSAHTIACIQDGHVCAHREQIVSRGQAGEPGAGDDHRYPSQGFAKAVSHVSTLNGNARAVPLNLRACFPW